MTRCRHKKTTRRKTNHANYADRCCKPKEPIYCDCDCNCDSNCNYDSNNNCDYIVNKCRDNEQHFDCYHDDKIMTQNECVFSHQKKTHEETKGMCVKKYGAGIGDLFGRGLLCRNFATNHNDNGLIIGGPGESHAKTLYTNCSRTDTSFDVSVLINVPIGENCNLKLQIREIPCTEICPVVFSNVSTEGRIGLCERTITAGGVFCITIPVKPSISKAVWEISVAPGGINNVGLFELCL